MNEPDWAGSKRLGQCGQQLVTNVYTKVCIHMKHNGTFMAIILVGPKMYTSQPLAPD